MALSFFSNLFGPKSESRTTKSAITASQVDLGQLSKPFWSALVIGSVNLLVFVSFLTLAMDRGTLRTSEQVLNSILRDRIKTIEGVVTEYGYWDEAVEAIVYQRNNAWIQDNLIESMLGTHELSNAHVFNGQGEVVVNIVDGRVVSGNLPNSYSGILGTLVEDARVKKQASEPNPVSAFVGSTGELHIASAINMTTYNSRSDINTDHVMVVTKLVDENYLANLRMTYDLWELKYVQTKPDFMQASIPVRNVNGQVIGRFNWNPSLAGTELLPLLAFGVLAVFVAMLFSARIYLRRATALIHDLEVARVQAEMAQAKLDKIARQDPLTGLENRRSLDDHMEQIKQGKLTTEKQYAFMSIDLDGFKQINDTLGHEAGDSVLRHFSALLENTVGEFGETYRLGGDEFCAVLFNADKRAMIRIGKKIIEVLSRKHKIDEHLLQYGASIGLTFSEDVDAWLSEADLALYEVKRNGRGYLEVYQDGLKDTAEVDSPKLNVVA